MRFNRVTGATFVSVMREVTGVTGVLPLLNRGDGSEWDDVDE